MRAHNLNGRLGTGKGKAMPIQPYTGPESSRRMGFPYFIKINNKNLRLSALRTGHFYHTKNIPGTQFIRIWVKPTAIEDYVDEKFEKTDNIPVCSAVPPPCPIQNCTQQFQAACHAAAVHCTGLLQTAGQYIKQQFYTIIVLPDDGPVWTETCSS